MPRLHASRCLRQQGMTLVELMVAMVLGLIVIAGAVTLLLANRQSYRTSEGLSQVQEGARTAFELLARDVRQAGVTGCDNAGRVANVLLGTQWWQSWFGVRGYDEGQVDPAVAVGTVRGARVAGTDSIQLQGIAGPGLTVDTHVPGAGTFNVNGSSTSIVPGTVMLVCDFDHAALFSAATYTADPANPDVITYVQGAANCSTGLGFPTSCASPAGNPWQFRRNSLLAPLAAVDWYVGQSGRSEDSGRSLFRLRLANDGSVVTEEVVADITDMQVTYRLANAADFAPAASTWTAIDWAGINAIRIAFTVDSADTGISTDRAVNSGRLQRTFTQVIALRNRVP